MEYREITADYAKKFSGFYPDELGKDPDFDEYTFIIAVDEDILCGMAVLDLSIDEVTLKSISVSKPFQNHGIGMGLIGAIQTIIRKRYYELLEEEALYLSVSDVRKPRQWDRFNGFLERCGFTISEQYPVMNVSAKELSENPVLAKELAQLNLNKVYNLENISDMALREFNNRCVKEKLYPAIDRDEYDKDSSLFYVDDDKVIACVLNHAGENCSYHNDWVYLVPGSDARILMGLISASVNEGIKISPDKANVFFLPVNKKSAKMKDAIAPGSVQVYEYRNYSKRILPLGVFVSLNEKNRRT